MNRPSTVALMLFCAVFSFGYQPARAAAPLAKVIMTTGSISEREGAVYVAQERGFFRKYGVDVSFVQVRNGPVGMAALSSGRDTASLGIGVRGQSWGDCGGSRSRLRRRFHQQTDRHVRCQSENKQSNGTQR